MTARAAAALMSSRALVCPNTNVAHGDMRVRFSLQPSLVPLLGVGTLASRSGTGGPSTRSEPSACFAAMRSGTSAGTRIALTAGPLVLRW
ncbi:MAG: hypothetical protein BGO98_02700 [Myxococcales bacterium 68-20]|nr:MAG: hypothetical protein BGO98_02700 [Myxococcales bacterium 68-20]